MRALAARARKEGAEAQAGAVEWRGGCLEGAEAQAGAVEWRGGCLAGLLETALEAGLEAGLEMVWERAGAAPWLAGLRNSGGAPWLAGLRNSAGAAPWLASTPLVVTGRIAECAAGFGIAECAAVFKVTGNA